MRRSCRSLARLVADMWSKNGVRQPGELTAKEMMRREQSGAYTTARTVGGGSAVFQLQFHLDRIETSIRLMQQSEDDTADGRFRVQTNSSALTVLRRRLERVIAADLSRFARGLEPGSEMRFTLLVTWNPEDASISAEQYDILMHTECLPPPPEPPVVVEVRPASRSNPLAKDSKWVSERLVLERARGDGVNEVLLEDPAGQILEGSQTNFFAVDQKGVVHTANEGILMGTVRDVVLDVCRQRQIPVSLTPPRTSEASTWLGAFITSTSRLVLPIDCVSVPLAVPQHEHQFEPHPVVTSIAEGVKQDLLRKSSPIIDLGLSQEE